VFKVNNDMRAKCAGSFAIKWRRCCQLIGRGL
jgi:hypothetical protein